MPGIEEELGEGDGGVEREAGVAFEGGAGGGAAVTTADGVAEFGEAKDGGGEGAEGLLRGFASLGAARNRVTSEGELGRDLLVEVAEVVTVLVGDASLVEDELEGSLDELLGAGDGGGGVGGDGALDAVEVVLEGCVVVQDGAGGKLEGGSGGVAGGDGYAGVDGVAADGAGLGQGIPVGAQVDVVLGDELGDVVGVGADGRVDGLGEKGKEGRVVAACEVEPGIGEDPSSSQSWLFSRCCQMSLMASSYRVS